MINVSKIKTGIVETNTYFLSCGDGNCIVIDPGDDIAGIFAFLSENNLKPKTVLLTHALLTTAMPLVRSKLTVREYLCTKKTIGS